MSEFTEFKFPVRKEQLCDEPADTNRFWVKTRKNLANKTEDALLAEVEEMTASLRGGSCVMILDNDIFDIAYSLLYYMEDLPPAVRRDLL
jgi:hypothetical protein